MNRSGRADIPGPNSVISQFAVFAGVGALGTAGHYAVLVVLVQAANASPTYSSALGFVVGALINYSLNYRYTFRSTKSHQETLIKFMLVAIFGFFINTGIMYLGTELMQVNYLIVQIASTAIVLVTNFAFNKTWTFACK